MTKIAQIIFIGLLSLLILNGCVNVQHQGMTVSKKTKAKATQTAKKQIGKPYRYGGKTPQQGFDCSGLIVYSYHQSGVQIPRSTKEQFKHFKPTRKPMVGDILFFGSAGKPSHSGIYLGAKKMLHAPTTGKNVEIVRFDLAYWQKRYLGAKIVTTL